MKFPIVVASEDEWPAVWKTLSEMVLSPNPAVQDSDAPAFQGAPILALVGDLGAGKTTFVKTIVAALGSTDPVTSPSFSIVQEYSTHEGPIYHFDLYRLRDLAELYDLDFEEYLRRGRLVIVEWPQLAQVWLRELGATFLELRHLPTSGREVVLLEDVAAGD